MPPRRVQLKSTLATVIAEAKKNFDEQKQCFQQEAGDLVEKWHQNSLRNFDALQLRISELLLNVDCSQKQVIAKIEKPVEPMKKIDPSMPSLDTPTKQPSVVDLIESLEHFVDDQALIQAENEFGKSLESSVHGIDSQDPMFGFANLPIVMTPSTAPTPKPFMSTTFDVDFSNGPVTFSDYELNEIGELTLLSVDNIENGNSGEQKKLPNGSDTALEQPNHSNAVIKPQTNANKTIKHTTDAIPLKRRKIDENVVPNTMKLPNGVPKKGSMHKIIVDKETLAQMREQKKQAKKADAAKRKATATEMALLF